MINIIVVTGSPKNINKRINKALSMIDETKFRITITPLQITNTLLGIKYTESIIYETENNADLEPVTEML